MAYRGSFSSVQAIGNMQWRQEGISAANDAIDSLLSTADFATNPDIVLEQVKAGPFAYDANADGTNDIQVTFGKTTVGGVEKEGPRCVRFEQIPNTALDPSNANDLGCFASGSAANTGLGIATGGGGTSAVTQGTSLCSNTEWMLPLVATDAVTNTTVQVIQGVGVRVSTAALGDCE